MAAVPDRLLESENRRRMQTNHSFLGILFLSGIFAILTLPGCAPHIPAAAPIPTSTPDPNLPKPLEYSGSGSAGVALGPWSGEAILHLSGSGKGPLRAGLMDGLNVTELVQTDASSNGTIDEYRGISFGSTGQVRLSLQGDWTWQAGVLPAAEGYFPVLNVPGTYTGSGSAVVLLEGEYGLAIFRSDDLSRITAWSYGPGGVGEKLSFKLTGDYAGRAVLPEGAGWIVVSGPASWSLEVQAPCCKAPPGYKPTPLAK